MSSEEVQAPRRGGSASLHYRSAGVSCACKTGRMLRLQTILGLSAPDNDLSRPVVIFNTKVFTKIWMSSGPLRGHETSHRSRRVAASSEYYCYPFPRLVNGV